VLGPVSAFDSQGFFVQIDFVRIHGAKLPFSTFAETGIMLYVIMLVSKIKGTDRDFRSNRYIFFKRDEEETVKGASAGL